MINPVNSIELKPINYQKKDKEKTPKIGISEPMILSDYQIGQAILVRNNISFKNNSKPLDITYLYNKKVEGKDHLDLPNVKVYEFSDTNLKAYVNTDENCEKPQLAICIETNSSVTKPIEHTLINIITNNKLKNNDLAQYQDLDILSKNKFITTNSDFTFDVDKLSLINKSLTFIDYNDKDLYEAKEQLKTYLNSKEYKSQTQLSKVLYNNDLDNNIFESIDEISLNEIKKYHAKSLNNSIMNIYLTANDKFIKENDIINKLNKGLSIKFSKEVEMPIFSLNDNLKIIYKNGDENSVNFNYLIDKSDLKTDIIFKIISKLIYKNSTIEQKRVDNYLDNFVIKNYSGENVFDFKEICKVREEKNNFYSIAGEKFVDSVIEPINLNNEKFYGNYYILPYQSNLQDDISINILIANQNKYLCSLIKKDLNNDINEIKQDYKNYISTTLKGEQFESIKNLELSNLNKDCFKIYEIVDSISENEIKEFIEKYFINQPPIIEINEAKNNSKPLDITYLYNKKVEGKDHLDLPNVKVYEFPDTNLRVFINVNDNNIPDEDLFMYKPQVVVKLTQNNISNKSDILLNEYLFKLLCSRLNDNSNDIVTELDGNNLTYFEILSENNLENISKFNKIIFNLVINEQDIEILKSQEKEITDLTVENLQKYYDKNKNNLSLEMHIALIKEDFNDDFLEELKLLNKNISTKLKKNDAVSIENIKKDLSILYLNLYKDFGEDFLFQDCKSIYKEQLKEVLTGKTLPIIKAYKQSKFSADCYKLYENIDSISENEIRKH